MLITNHVLTGALLGSVVARPAAAAGAGFLSHFVLDAVPHFGVDEARLMRVAVPDGLLGLAAIAVINSTAPPHRRAAVLAGVFGACLPDVDKPAREFFDRSPFPGWFDRLHARIQPESPRLWPVEVVTAAACTAALMRLFRSATTGSAAQ